MIDKMHDGEVIISKKENIDEDNEIGIKCDVIERNPEGEVEFMQLKLTQVNSRFQIKIRLNKKGYNFLEKLFLEEFVSRERRKQKSG